MSDPQLTVQDIADIKRMYAQPSTPLVLGARPLSIFNMLDGAKTIAEASQRAHYYGDYLRAMDAEGWELRYPIKHGRGVAHKIRPYYGPGEESQNVK